MGLFSKQRASRSLRSRQRPPASRLEPWDQAVAALSTLALELCTTYSPEDRAALYERLAQAHEECARVVCEDIMPPLDPGEGTSYTQFYTDSAALLRLLADGEKQFGLYDRGSIIVPRAYGPRDLWDRYFRSTDRRARRDYLIGIYAAAEQTVGYGAAMTLHEAAESERAVTSRRGSHR